MQRILLLLAVLLTGCGGGGGGNGGNPYLRPSTVVPFSTPVKVTTLTPLVNSNTGATALTQSYTADLTGTGGENFITAGQMQPGTASTWNNSQISILGWQSGQLVDQTSQWFSPGENVVVGGNTIKFADFTNSGHQDMLVVGSTDTNNFFSPSYVYFNNGSSFTRTTISPGTFNAHDAVVYDFFNTGFPDILFTDYGPNSTLAKNNQDGTFTNYTQSASNITKIFGASSFAAGDFLNNTTATIIATDQCNVGCTQFTNKLYAIAIDTPTSNLIYTELSTLPAPRFALAKWAGFNFGDGVRPPSHDIRALSYDWNNNGIMDAIIISRPNLTNGQWPKFSEVQFLQNNGTGTFADVTDTVLVGYDTSTSASYNPKFVDVNGDGRVDILLSGPDFTTNNNSSQILINTKDGKFVAAFQNILTDFGAQSIAMQSGANKGNGNIVNIIKSPDNKMYLVTEVNYMDSNTHKQSVYLSLLGASTVTSAEAISTLKTQWPWMSDASANAVLASTGATYLNGRIIDMEAAMKPVGSLTINAQPMTGYIAGLKLSAAQSQIVAMDTLGRDFSVNVSPMQVNSLSAWERTTHFDQKQLSSQSEYLVPSYVASVDGMRMASDTISYSLGTPAFRVTDNITARAQITNIANFNPWVQFSGIWGNINSSGIMETTFTYQNANFQGQVGIMNVNSNITPGLITRIDPITAMWSELGYVENKFGVYAGIKPVIVSGGTVDVNLPTGFDIQGNMQYTRTKVDLQSPVTGYVRAVYSDSLNKELSYKVSGMYVDNGQYRLQTELKYSY